MNVNTNFIPIEVSIILLIKNMYFCITYNEVNYYLITLNMNLIHKTLKNTFVYSIILLTFTLMSCDGTGTQGKGLMSSSGRASELLVVCADSQWKGLLGDSLRSVFLQPLPYLLQDEPLFLVVHIDEDGFNPIYQKQRNILHIDINPQHIEPKIRVVKNKWAKPQLIVLLQAQNESEAIQFLLQKKEIVIDLFLESEIKRFQRAQKAQQDYKINKKLQDSYHISMNVPEGYIFAVHTKDFCWLRKETERWGQSMLIYIQNYEDTNMFSNDYIVDLRNQMTRQYVFGSVDNSYMIVDAKYIPSETKYIDFQGNYAVKTQGVWKMMGDFMGGSYINYTILDEKRSRIITLDGFLYAPTDDKRDLLRQIEAMLLSTQIID